MSAHPFPPTTSTEPAEALERATAQLDAALLAIGRLIGTNAMQARVAGRVLRAQRQLAGTLG